MEETIELSNVENEKVTPHCSEFVVIPDEEKKTISILPSIDGAIIELSKDMALLLISIIQDCVQKL